MSPAAQVLGRTINYFMEGIVAAFPRIVSGTVFLVLAYLAIKVGLTLVRAPLERLYPVEERLVVDLIVTVLAVFLWFGAGLAFLKIVGMGDIAASLGTATGFIALGISYALSDMIEDTVAGVYLLRDPDFNVGDRVNTDAATGIVAAIELRKSRIETENGDRVVVANRNIESEWTRNVSET